MGFREISILLVSLVLTGCPSTPDPEIPQAPIEASGNFADKQDKAIERAAGYVKVAKDVNATAEQTPPVKTVGVLLDAAGSYLDKPSQKDIEQAKALAADHSRLDKVKEDADKTIKEINTAWEAVVKDSERRRVEAEQGLRKAQMELEVAAKREQDHLLGMLGAGLIALGALSLLFGHWVGIGKLGSVGIMVAGAGTAALPRLFGAKEFVWGSLAFIGIAALQALIYLSRRLWGAVKPVDKPVDPPLTEDR